MPVPSVSKAVLAPIAMMLAAMASPASGAPAALRWDEAFSTAAAPATFHARLAYRTADGVHHAALWRDGDRRLRRDTDARLTTVVTRTPGTPAFRLDLFDSARRMHTVVDRNSLYRIGRFTDWDDLAFGLRRPAGRYTVRTLAGFTASVAPAAPCTWYALDSGGHRTRICWSRRYAYPMLMLDDAGRPTWRVQAVDTVRPAPALFHPDDTGYVVNDAARDISDD